MNENSYILVIMNNEKMMLIIREKSIKNEFVQEKNSNHY